MISQILQIIILNVNYANSIQYISMIKINVKIKDVLVINNLLEMRIRKIINNQKNKLKLKNSILLANLVNQSQAIVNIFMKNMMEIAKNASIVYKMILIVFKILKYLNNNLK